MALPETDNFNRADANPIGGNWSTVAGAGAIRLYNNQISGSSSTSGEYGAIWTVDSFNNDQYSQIIFEASVSRWYGMGPITRGSATVQTRYQCLYYDDSGQGDYYLELAKWINGIWSSCGNMVAPVSFVSGDAFRLASIGSTHTAYRNGLQIAQWIDNSITAGGAGVMLGSSDDIADNWEGGNIVSGIAVPVLLNQYRRRRN